MPTTYTEFDKTFLKTHKSRSVRFTPNKSKGFTLIELLVVISIIALLSTIVLSVVQDGRAKARNATKNNLVLEYIKALELYKNENNTYPNTGTSPVCIGYKSSPLPETCYGSISGSDTLTSSLTKFLPGDFADRKSIIINNIDFKGVLYSCSNSSCDSYNLSWVIEKQNQKCISDSTFSSFGSNTSCSYIKK